MCAVCYPLSKKTIEFTSNWTSMCPVNSIVRAKKSYFTVVELKRKLTSNSTDKFMIFFFVFIFRYASYAAQPSQSYGQSAQVGVNLVFLIDILYISACTVWIKYSSDFPDFIL